MAELTKLESKLGEVVGLAMAAQAATRAVSKLARADGERGVVAMLRRMQDEAKQAEQRGRPLPLRSRGKSQPYSRKLAR